MNAKRKIRRALVTMLSVALLAACTLMPAMAAGVTSNGGADIDTITVTDIINTDGMTYAPVTSVAIAVDEGPGKTFNDGTGNVTALPGVVGGLTGTTINFTSEYRADGVYSKTGTLAVNDSVFDAAGIYHYVVTQTAGTYEGITYSTETYDVYLYVMNNTALTDLYVGYVVSVKQGETAAKADLVFTNDYGDTYDTTHDVKVVKHVAGNQGDLVNDEFKFNVSVAGTQANAGEVYLVVVDYDTNAENAGKDMTVTVTAGGDPYEVTIKHNGSITIYGLSENDTYTIEETNGVALGYTVDNNKSNDRTGKVTGTTTEDGESYIVTNTKTANVPTGVIMNVAPYALMVVIAAAGAFVFLRKRAED